MTTVHNIRFPRYPEDITTGRRTLFHAAIGEQQWAVGDGLRLLAAPNLPRCKVGVLIDVRQVRLHAELDADLDKLAAANRDEYLARWDALHPEQPSNTDPLVWRIEFRYGMWPNPTDPPEWSLAA